MTGNWFNPGDENGRLQKKRVSKRQESLMISTSMGMHAAREIFPAGLRNDLIDRSYACVRKFEV